MTAVTPGMLPLDRSEMLALYAGGDGGESFAKDVGYFIGAVIGTCWYALTHPPEASYSYAKVGY